MAPGGTAAVDVPFTPTCSSTSHVVPGSTIAVVLGSTTVPLDGAIDFSPGVVGPVPADWPASGDGCPASGEPSLVSATPAHIILTAPTTVGTGYAYTFLCARDPETGLRGLSALTFTVDVVAPAPADTTPPTLDLPADVTVFTADRPVRS